MDHTSEAVTTIQNNKTDDERPSVEHNVKVAQAITKLRGKRRVKRLTTLPPEGSTEADDTAPKIPKRKKRVAKSTATVKEPETENTEQQQIDQSELQQRDHSEREQEQRSQSEQQSELQQTDPFQPMPQGQPSSIPNVEGETLSERSEEHQTLIHEEHEQQRLIDTQTTPLITRTQPVPSNFDMLKCNELLLYTYTTSNKNPVEAVITQLKEQILELRKLEASFAKLNQRESAAQCVANINLLENRMQELNNATENRCQPVDLEEEGIFVPPQPPLLARGSSHIEQRLLRQNRGLNRNFDENGILISEPYPFYKEPMRPFPLQVQGFQSTEESEPPPVKTFNPQGTHAALLSKEGRLYHLQIDIREIQFTDHPLMSEEEYIATQLTEEVKHFDRVRNSRLSLYYTQKLMALRSSLSHYKEQYRASVNRLVEISPQRQGEQTNHLLEALKSSIWCQPMIAVQSPALQREATNGLLSMSSMAIYLRQQRELFNTVSKIYGTISDIKRCRQQLEMEEVQEKELLRSILAHWRKLKRLRETNLVSTSTAKVSFERIPTDAGSETIGLERGIEEELEEQYDEMEAIYLVSLQESTRMGETAELPSRSIISDEQRNQRREEISQRHRRSKRGPGTPIIIPKLKLQEATTVQNLPQSERERRNAIRASQFYISLLVNGRYVSRTKTTALSPNFTVSFEEIIPVYVVKWPERICVQIYQRGWLFDTLVGSVYLQPPGADHGDLGYDNPIQSYASSSAPESQRLRFSSAESHIPSWIQPALSRSRFWNPLLESRQQYNERCKLLDESSTRHTSGSILTHTEWINTDPEDQTASYVPPIPQSLRSHSGHENHSTGDSPAPTAKDLLNLQRLHEWMKSGDVDPNDPRNSDLASMLQMFSQNSLTRKGFFLSQHDDALFNVRNNLLYNKRLQLYKLKEQLREIGVTSINITVPLDESSITYEMLEEAETIVSEAQQKAYYNKHASEFVNRIRQRLQERLRTSGVTKKTPHSIQLSSIVNEVPIPSFSTTFSWLQSFFEPRRPLNPIRKERKVPPTAASGRVERCQIILQVIRGHYIPKRRQGVQSYALYRSSRLSRQKEISRIMRGKKEQLESGAQGLGSSAIESENMEAQPKLKEEVVLPFVSVTFQGQVLRTRAVEGCSPQFNETLILDFHPRNDDFSPENLRTVRDSIYLDIFDEVTIDNLHDERDYQITDYRTETRWLGSLTIPFSTLYANGKIEGTCSMKRPVINLGYDHHMSPLASTGVSALSSSYAVGSTIASTAANNAGGPSSTASNAQMQHMSLTLCVTLEPLLPPLQETQDIISSGEKMELYSYALWWEKAMRQRRYCSNRAIRALVPTSEGKATLVMRFIRPLEPPAGMLTPTMVARFVSMIPFLEDVFLFDDKSDIWFSCQELLEIQASDEEEHAILLCNYMLHLKKEAYVVLGLGIPEGNTAYVLMIENGTQYTLWHACSGKRYNINDTHCPLRQINTVFNDTNIWANVQRESQPAAMSFNFSDSSSWEPFFGGRYPQEKLDSIQATRLRYIDTPETFVFELEEKIETALYEKITLWRKKHNALTKWNTTCGKILKRLCKDFEHQIAERGPFVVAPNALKRSKEDSASGDGNEQSVQWSELEPFLSSFWMSGFPLNFPYTDISAIVQEVYNTKIHINAEPDVEFALGVYVHPYPNRICSVWVYLAVLTPLN